MKIFKVFNSEGIELNPNKFTLHRFESQGLVLFEWSDCCNQWIRADEKFFQVKTFDEIEKELEKIKLERDEYKRQVNDLREGIKGYERNNNNYHELLKILRPLMRIKDGLDIGKLKRILNEWDLNDLEKENKELRTKLKKSV